MCSLWCQYYNIVPALAINCSQIKDKLTNGPFVGSFAEGQVTGHGCSTKDKVFYKEDETHSYGEHSL